MPNNDTCTFSPTALKHYNNYQSVITNHLQSLHITTSSGITMTFPSIPTKINNNILDYHKFDVVKPISTMNINIHQPIVKSIKTTQPITRTLLHQRLAHCNSRKLDTMCRLNTLHGLPPNLSRNDNRECPICLMSKFSHPPKGKTINTEALHPGELLHIDFGFWDIPSHRGFTSMLLIIDAKTRML